LTQLENLTYYNFFSKLYINNKEKTRKDYTSDAKILDKSSEVVKQVQRENGYYFSMTDSEKFEFADWLNKLILIF
jgi:hypothetical protein